MSTTTTTPRAVNFEFPLSRLSEALHYVAALGLIEPTGLHLHATAQWANDKEIQVCATAWTTAPDTSWDIYCKTFSQECVSLSADNGPTGHCVGPVAWDYLPQYFKPAAEPVHIIT